MGATLRQTLVKAVQGLAADTLVQYSPFAPAGPTQSQAALTGPGAGGAPSAAVANQEVYEALCRRRITIPFTDGGTAATAVAEEPVFCVPSVVTSGVPSGVSQGMTVKAVSVVSLVALASGIANGAPGWTVTVQKRSPQVTGLGSAQIALATTQTGDPALGAGSAAFQAMPIPVSAQNASVSSNTAGGSLGQTITAGAGSTITVVSTAGFLSQGTINVPNAAGGSVPMSYTGITATTFTGAIGSGFTTPAAAAAVTPNPVATNSIAAGSNGASLPQATINVASTVGFLPATAAQPQTIQVTTASGVQTVSYTGMTTTTFTGCTGGAGAMATGGLVQGAPVALLANGDTLTFTLAKVSTGLAVGSATGQAVLVVELEES